jgi:hypothetical protein
MHNDDDSPRPEPPPLEKPAQPSPAASGGPDAIPLDKLYPPAEPQDPEHPDESYLTPVLPDYSAPGEGPPLTTDAQPMGPIILITPIRSAADFARLDIFATDDE